MKLYNVGADLSEKKIDFVIHQFKAFLKVANTISGFQELIKWLHQHGIALSGSHDGDGTYWALQLPAGTVSTSKWHFVYQSIRFGH